MPGSSRSARRTSPSSSSTSRATRACRKSSRPSGSTGDRNAELAAALDGLKESTRKLELLEQVKRELVKFVPEAVTRLLEQHPDARELEKREADVSVLFLDVEGYTRLSEELPPQRLNRRSERRARRGARWPQGVDAEARAPRAGQARAGQVRARGRDAAPRAAPGCPGAREARGGRLRPLPRRRGLHAPVGRAPAPAAQPEIGTPSSPRRSMASRSRRGSSSSSSRSSASWSSSCPRP